MISLNTANILTIRTVSALKKDLPMENRVVNRFDRKAEIKTLFRILLVFVLVSFGCRTFGGGQVKFIKLISESVN